MIWHEALAGWQFVLNIGCVNARGVYLDCVLCVSMSLTSHVLDDSVASQDLRTLTLPHGFK